MKIEIEVDDEQLSILMSGIESMLPHCGPRTADTLNEAIEVAAQRWSPGEDEFLYMAVKVAPVYRRLLHAWGGRETEVGNIHATDLFGFVSALRAARVGSNSVPCLRHAPRG
jgi:hypothetical protein